MPTPNSQHRRLDLAAWRQLLPSFGATHSENPSPSGRTPRAVSQIHVHKRHSRSLTPQDVSYQLPRAALEEHGLPSTR